MLLSIRTVRKLGPYHKFTGCLMKGTGVCKPSERRYVCCKVGGSAPAAAYVHLPFCKRKCFYCDFPVEAVGLDVNKTRTQDRMQAYVELVCSEIRATAAALDQQPLETVSFGGGTPSVVPPHLLKLILQTLQQQFGISPSAEISLEADPGTFDLDRLLQYKELGVNRLSMGVQCFQEELLQVCGRSHSLADVHAAIQAVQAADMPSWSLDLISGLPQLTTDKWRDSLQQAIAAQPDHISVYDLQVEEGTPFARWYSGSASRALPLEPDAVEMFELASLMLDQAGYEHYEISNYAKPGHRSLHNQVYWRCQPYYAFGLGAASYVQGKRFTRPRSMKQYEQWVQEYVQSGTGCPAAHLPAESQEEQLLDTIMLSLRLSDGLSLQQLQANHGWSVVAALLPAIRRLMAEGLMQLTPEYMLLHEATGCNNAADTKQQLGDDRGDGHVHALNQNSIDIVSSSSLQEGSLVRAHSEVVQQQQHRNSSRQIAGLSHEAAFAVSQERLRAGGECGVRLTDPAGFLMSNDVISDLFAELDVASLSTTAA